MLIDLQAPLAVGDTVSLTLDFEGGHNETFDLPVREISAEGHAHHAGHGDHAAPAATETHAHH